MLGSFFYFFKYNQIAVTNLLLYLFLATIQLDGIKYIHVVMHLSALSISTISSSSKTKTVSVWIIVPILLTHPSSWQLPCYSLLLWISLISYFIKLESYTICPFVFGIFHLSCLQSHIKYIGSPCKAKLYPIGCTDLICLSISWRSIFGLFLLFGFFV